MVDSCDFCGDIDGDMMPIVLIEAIRAGNPDSLAIKLIDETAHMIPPFEPPTLADFRRLFKRRGRDG